MWDGGSARQIGLVDQFGGLDDALAWAAAKAGLEDGGWHPYFLGAEVTSYDSLLRQWVMGEEARGAPQDVFAMLAGSRSRTLDRIAADVDRLATARGVQAYCLECPAPRRVGGDTETLGWLARLASLLD